ncbi:response regulator transcription factor [Burkholderia cenocepacia]|uniref:response regulator transcription factor n=1 Tax=Burkholderia cenocepacia TaxID=95486 RepID=UPI002ABD97EE|nr:response regulator transcription factor [Burkholderia cenocepacia]
MHSLILIVDDTPDMSSTLDTCLIRNGFRTFQTTTAQPVLAARLNLKPDLVILDVRQLRADILEMLANLRRQCDTPVVVVSERDLDKERVRALHAGADDYIVRPFNPEVVVARLLAILRRSCAFAPARRLRVGMLEIDMEHHVAYVRTSFGVEPMSVTLAEFRLLAYMAKVPNHAFTRIELLNACMTDASASTRTVDGHMSRLRRKLMDAGVSGVLESVHGVGYRLRKPGCHGM